IGSLTRSSRNSSSYSETEANNMYRADYAIFQCPSSWFLSVAVVHALLGNVCLAQPAPPRPGPQHETLRKMEGTWDASLTFPGGVKAKGTMTCKMECGGLWLVRDLEVKLGKLTLQTKELEGYDPVTKKHVSIQVDSMSTMPMRLEGDFDEATKALIQTGEA